MTSAADQPAFLAVIEYAVDGVETQHALGAAFVDLQERWVRSWPGYRSAQIIASTDGQRLYNIVSWADEASFRSFEEHADSAGRLQAIQDAVDAVTAAGGRAASRMAGLPQYRLLHAVQPPTAG